jgi:pyruvate dehydrogenase kinase 2/3/4
MLLQGVAELKRELSERAVLTEMPEIHQFLDGFYLSRIGIRILIGAATCSVMSVKCWLM